MATEIDVLQEKMNWHWRNSMRTVRFFSFDARASLPLPLLLVYARTSTLVLSIVFLLVFRYLERKGLTFPAAVRNFRSWIIGRDRPGWINVHRKNFNDFS